MKKIALLLLLIYGNRLIAQVPTKKNISKAALNYSAAKPGPTTVNLSAGDLVSIANSSMSTLTTSPILSQANVLGANGTVLASDQGDNYVQDKISQSIYGNSTTSEYGITYSSQPVLYAYKTYLQPYGPLFEQMNTDFYEGKLFKGMIATAIADQLILCAENIDVYTTPGSRKILREEVEKEFANDDFSKESETASYYHNRLVAIFERTKSYLNYCTLNYNANGYTDKYGKKSQTCKDDFSNSFYFMCSFGARNNCVVAVIVAKSKIALFKSSTKLTQAINDIKWAYTPLLLYKNQSSAFDLYAIKLKVLQSATKNGTLYTFYDKDNKCPSPQAFGLFTATKVRTATATNTLK